MSKIDKLIDNKIAQNIVVWLFLFIILSVSITAPNKILSAAFIVLFLAPNVYLQNLIILPYLKKNSILFLVLTLLNTALITLVANLLLIKSLAINSEGFMKGYVNLFGFIFIALVFGSAVKIARNSFYRRQQEKEAELKLLKAQLNPHFLFNTLNNLYGLSVIKSDKLPGLMLKLSDLLRYSLYETKDVFVPLSKEVSYLENYISLERIRLENTEINFEVHDAIDDKVIAPMLFIVFVENAFKHLSTEKSKVTIEIISEENKMHFNCENTIDSSKPIEENLEKGKSGIGLVNAKKRLELMYPEKHELKINNLEDIFSVQLTIEI